MALPPPLCFLLHSEPTSRGIDGVFGSRAHRNRPLLSQHGMDCRFKSLDSGPQKFNNRSVVPTVLRNQPFGERRRAFLLSGRELRQPESSQFRPHPRGRIPRVSSQCLSTRRPKFRDAQTLPLECRITDFSKLNADNDFRDCSGKTE